MSIITHNKQQGYGLVEVLLALSLGLIVLGATSSVVVDTVKQNSDAKQASQLEQELGRIADAMAKNISRAGYSLDAINQLQNNPFGPVTPANLAVTDCILFSYDIDAPNNTPGVIDVNNGGNNVTTELMGYRFDRLAHAVETRAGNLGCADTGWQDLTDPGFLVIDNLTIQRQQSNAGNIPYNGQFLSILRRNAVITLSGCLRQPGGGTATCRDQNNNPIATMRTVSRVAVIENAEWLLTAQAPPAQ